MTMKDDDLTQVKHIGPSRMKVLNDNGIRTIKQLYETPLEKLVRIAPIGERYAKLIKSAVTEYYGESAKKPIPAPMAAPRKEEKTEELNQNLEKRINALYKSLTRANEVLKPLGKKKYLELYIDFKKKSKTLKKRIDALNQNQGNLTNKRTKSIIKKADALNATLENVGKKTKKKKYQKLSKQIRSFSKMLRDANA
jgi:nucleotidyltransferase/DNA polymerase involved in DNA repair